VQPAAEERADGGTLPVVVGVGASAGGLEAFTELLSHLADDTGMAFVLIQHLDPKHESHLTELLFRASKMPVAEVKGETAVEANHVYVIPPGSNLSISSGVLHTAPRPSSGRNMPIDSFLRALAADQGSKALGVIMSGTASDGTLGLEAIKAAGGVTFVQETSTAKFDSMPRSAIAAGVADFVLPPAGIARQLMAIARNSQARTEPWEAMEPPGDPQLAKILRLVRSATGVDFTHYKHSTLARRIKRRMALRGFQELEDYSRDLEKNREEASALCESCLITVTAFFREAAVFEELKKRVFPALLENRAPGDPIRIWVPGCSTGEEAYSIAICLTEFLDDAEVSVTFEVFATDLSQTAIEKARSGTYSDAALVHVSPQRLVRFFIRKERGRQVAKSIRDVCVFARHNVAEDPPFSKLDLISCCNVLIYLGAAWQRKVLSTLHYSLKPTGFLVLGPSESASALPESFHQVEKTHKIYYTQPAAGAPAPPLRRPGGSTGKNRGWPRGAGCAERSGPAGAGRIWAHWRHRRRRYEHRSGPGPHGALPGAFAGRADPESSETGARRLDCRPGQGHPRRQTNPRRGQGRRIPGRRWRPVEGRRHQGAPVRRLVLFQGTLFPGSVRGRRAKRGPGGDGQTRDAGQRGKRPAAARAYRNQGVPAIHRRG
jgi:two-component system CheB/CheR fusion protein